VRGSHGVSRIKERARRLRSQPTDAEMRLWSKLRNKQLSGHKFVRQFAVGPYFADFVCREAMLIIELDGGQHADAPADERRTRYLNAQGYAVLRFWNREVLSNTEGTLDQIAAVLMNCPSPDLRFAPATFSPEGRGAEAALPPRTFSDLRE
jgi:very-short-patch-repair endonuclease